MYRVTRARVILAVVMVPLLAVGAHALGKALWRRHQYRAAEEALDRRDFAAARARLDKYLGAEPHDLAARLLAARAARRARDFDAARRHLVLFSRENGPAEDVEREVRLMDAQQGDVAEAARLLALCDGHPDDPATPARLEAAIEGSLPSLAAAYAASLTGPAVEIVFAKEGRKKAAKLSEGHKDKPVAILVGGKVIAAPVVKATLGESVLITGKFTKEEAEQLAKSIRGK